MQVKRSWDSYKAPVKTRKLTHAYLYPHTGIKNFSSHCGTLIIVEQKCEGGGRGGSVNCPKTFYRHCTFCEDLIFIPIMKFSASILLNYCIILYKFNHVVGSG